MAKVVFIQNTFKSGEIGGRLHGRTEINQYFDACDSLVNMVPMKQGGVTGRMGGRFKQALATRTALLPFIFSKDEAYIISINPLAFAGRPHFTITRNDDTFGVIGGTNSVLNGKGSFFPFPEDIDLNGFHYTQLGDLLFVVHNSGTIPPLVISRTAIDAFNVDWYNKGVILGDKQHIKTFPFQATNTNTTTNLRPSALTGVITITAETPAPVTLAQFFDEGMIDTMVRITHGATEGVARITSLVAPVLGKSGVVNATVLVDFGAVTRQRIWHLSEWSDLNGWPRSITAVEGRLIFGGNSSKPDTVWGSLVGNVFNVMEKKLDQDKGATADASGLDYFGELLDSDPFEYIPASSEVNSISWLSSAHTLNVGTLGTEYVVSGEDRLLSSFSVSFRAQTFYGSSPVMPTRLDKSIYFVSRDGKTVRDFNVDEGSLAAHSSNLNVLNQEIIGHLFPGVGDFNGIEIIELMHQPATNIVWVLTSNGALLSFTAEPNTEVLGWSRHTFGGDGARVHSIATIPNADGTYDDLWLQMTRMGSVIQNAALGATTDTVDVDSGLLFRKTQDGGGASEEITEVKIPFTHTPVILSGKYFNLWSAGDATAYYVWFDLDGGSANPAPGGKTAIEVDILSTDTRLQIMEKMSIAIQANVDFNASDGIPTLEKIGDIFEHPLLFNTSPNEDDKPYFMDSSVRANDTTSKQVHGGFNHLAGEVVNVLADGFVVANKLVSAIGEIDLGLGNTATEVIAGLQYNPRLKTMPLEAGGDFGSSVGIVQRIDQAKVLFYKTFGPLVGYEDGLLEELEYQPLNAALGDPLVMFTGRKHIDFPSSPEDEQFVIIEQDKPLPITVLSIAMRAKTHDQSR